MLSDRQLSRISLIITIIGVVSLAIFSFSTMQKRVEIKDINYNILGENIEVIGIVSNEPRISKNTLLFVLSDDRNNTINVVMFNVKESDIKKGDKILVSGKVSEYKNQLEIIAKNIEVLESR